MAKKILSLDGGGSWAVLQIIALREIYKEVEGVGTKCGDILNQFDVISSNSGGSLVLALMIEKADEDIDEVLGIFQNEELRGKIFSKLKLKDWTFTRLYRLFGVGPKYKASRKISGLEEVLKNTGKIKMHELKKNLKKLKPQIVMCAFDYDLHRAVFFKTDQGGQNYEYTLADAVNASTNAPVNYFDSPVKFNYDNYGQHQYWDGAIGGNNNPVLIGITEALRLFPGLERTSEDIVVLTIGNGTVMFPVDGFTKGKTAVRKELIKPISKSSLGADLTKMNSSIIMEPPDAANFMAHMMLGGTEKSNSRPCIVRINPMIQPFLKDGVWKFPESILPEDEDDFLALTTIDIDAVKTSEMNKILKLANWWIADKVANQSIRFEGKTFQCLIGHDRFSKAKEDWLQRSLVRENLSV